MLKYLFKTIHNVPENERKNVIYKSHIIAIISVIQIMTLLSLSAYKMKSPNMLIFLILMIFCIGFIVGILINMRKYNNIDIRKFHIENLDHDFGIMKIFMFVMFPLGLMFLGDIIFRLCR